MSLRLARLLVFAMLTACGGEQVPADAGSPDADTHDAGTHDAGTHDAGAARDSGTVDDAGLEVQVTGGLIVGTTDGPTLSFRGIPYAAPPLGALRWAPPAPVLPWAGTRAATQFGAECPQFENDGGLSGSEDCLFLNVWAPDASRAGARPVMVFIHGGGLSEGSAAQPLYHAADLAQRTGAVVVTLQYRLGAFGFLAHPALSAEVNPPTSGTYGILDQIAALQWVKQNIATFGGDATRVTLIGESAGATSVATLVASPLARGLFSGAVVQSAGLAPNPTLAAAESAGTALAGLLGCSTATCLRGLSAQAVLRPARARNFVFADLVRAPKRYAFFPPVDGHLLTDTVLGMYRSGAHNHVPVLLGHNAEEAGYFAALGSLPRVTDRASYQSGLLQVVGTNAAAVAATYPAATDAAAFQTWLTALSDGAMICPARKAARALKQGQTNPVYRYHFTQRLRGVQQAFGAFHTLELFFIFRSFEAYGYTPNAAEFALTDTMQGYWGRFAISANPNGSGAPAWPAFVTGTDDALELGPSIAPVQHVREASCDFWDSLGLY